MKETIQWRKTFQSSDGGVTGHPKAKKESSKKGNEGRKETQFHITYTKTNSKWITVKRLAIYVENRQKT